MNGKNTTLPSLRNIEWRTVKMETEKINQVLTYISTNITELNELIDAGAKLVCEKIGITKKKIKTWRGNSTGNADKTSTKTNQKGKGNTRKNNNTTWGNKLESTGERRNIKEISPKRKTIQTKQDIPKQRKEIQPTSWGRWHENILTTGCKRNRTILD